MWVLKVSDVQIESKFTFKKYVLLISQFQVPSPPCSDQDLGDSETTEDTACTEISISGIIQIIIDLINTQ